jgi:hypothetical protein
MSRCRVFFSYSREDRALASQIVDHLKRQEVHVMWDQDLKPGVKFRDEINKRIAYAHVFMPLITARSAGSGWVHQEIGLATALNVPTMPITIGKVPKHLLDVLNAEELDEQSVSFERLTAENIEEHAYRKPGPTDALYVCAEEVEDRARMLSQYAEEVAALDQYGLVRQRAAVTSLHIPRETQGNEVWKTLLGGRYDSGQSRIALRAERISLEKHARKAGCRLIIYPEAIVQNYPADTAIVRLGSLVDFLKDMPVKKVEIAWGDRLVRGENITVLGDWFSASAVGGAPGQGYRQTIFTRHGPTVRVHAETFDDIFEEALRKSPWGKNQQRDGAIAYLNRLIAEARRGPMAKPAAKAATASPKTPKPRPKASKAAKSGRKR